MNGEKSENYEMGMMQLKRGELRDAEMSFRIVIEQYPTCRSAYKYCSLALDQIGDPEEVIDLFQGSVIANPYESWPLLELAKRFSALGREESALATIKKAIDADPLCIDCHLFIAVLYDAQGLHLEALHHCRIALSVNVDSSMANAFMAALCAKTGDLVSGVNYASRSVDLKPNNPEYIYDYAVMLSQLGDDYRATIEFRKVIKLDPSHSSAYNNLSILLIESDIEAALEYAECALKLDPNRWNLLSNVGYMWFKKAEYEKSIAYFRLALFANSDDARTFIIRRNLARGYLVARHYHDAIATFRECVVDRPHDPEARVGLLLALISGRQYIYALWQFIRVLSAPTSLKLLLTGLRGCRNPERC